MIHSIYCYLNHEISSMTCLQANYIYYSKDTNTRNIKKIGVALGFFRNPWSFYHDRYDEGTIEDIGIRLLGSRDYYRWRPNTPFWRPDGLYSPEALDPYLPVELLDEDYGYGQ